MTEAQSGQSDDDESQGGQRSRTVMVVGADGQPVGTMQVADDETQGAQGDGGEEHEDPGKLVEQPAKVMRIGSMVKQLLEEVRNASLDEAGRQRLREIHERSISELADGIAPELREELDRLAQPFSDDTTPSEAELRVAQAQLVGWLEGLFHGIQAALMAQQMAARVQLDQMRGGRAALPPGAQIPGGMPGQEAPGGGKDDRHPGQYL